MHIANNHCSFAYSTLARLRMGMGMGMSKSVSFQAPQSGMPMRFTRSSNLGSGQTCQSWR